MRFTIDVNLNLNHTQDTEIITLLKKIINQNNNAMSKITDIEAQVDALQTALDNEQAQIQTAIDGLNVTIQELRDQIAGGATDTEALDRIVTKLDGLKSDLEGTIADTPTEPNPPTE